MAEIKTTDIINAGEVTAAFQQIIDKMAEMINGYKQLSTTVQASSGKTKEMAAAQKDAAKLAADEAKAAKELSSAQDSLQKQRQAGLAAMAKEEAKKRELIEASKMEVKTLRDAEKRLKAMKELYRDMDNSDRKSVV